MKDTGKGMDEPTCCPHCKGTNGYEYSVTIRGVQWMNWNGTGENFDEKRSARTSAKRCVDCRKMVTV